MFPIEIITRFWWTRESLFVQTKKKGSCSRGRKPSQVWRGFLLHVYWIFRHRFPDAFNARSRMGHFCSVIFRDHASLQLSLSWSWFWSTRCPLLFDMTEEKRENCKGKPQHFLVNLLCGHHIETMSEVVSGVSPVKGPFCQYVCQLLGCVWRNWS